MLELQLKNSLIDFIIKKIIKKAVPNGTALYLY